MSADDDVHKLLFVPIVIGRPTAFRAFAAAQRPATLAALSAIFSHPDTADGLLQWVAGLMHGQNLSVTMPRIGQLLQSFDLFVERHRISRVEA
jgi:hypothetical protein